MNILLIDATSSFLDFALRCEAEGHSVRVFMGPTKEGLRSEVGDGLIEKVAAWEPHMKWADLVMCSDNTKYLHALDGYRKRGFPLWGPSVATANWELERGTGQRVFEAAGIPTIPGISFTSYPQAIALVKKTQKRYVSKPDGDADKALSYVSKSAADMCFMLDHWQRQGKGKPCFLMQEFIPGIEMAVGGWFGRNGFASQFLENFEFKKLMNGEVGVNTGEMGTLMRYVSAEESCLAQKVLLPLTGELFRQGYTGFVDVSVIIDRKGNPWPLEFTCRPGWPLFQIQQALHPDPCGWMLDLLQGHDTFKPLEEVAAGVVLTIPDFPYSTLTKKAVTGFPVWGITDKNRHHVHPAEMKLGKGPMQVNGSIVEKPMMVTAGDYVLVTSGTGDTVRQATEGAYAVLEELELPNSPMYRTDIGQRLQKQLPELRSLGYATAWRY